MRMLLVVLGREEFSQRQAEELLSGQTLQTFHTQNTNFTFHSRFRIYNMSLLQQDATRQIRDCPLPFQRSYTYQDITAKGQFDIPKLMDFFRREGRLNRQIVLEIVKRAIHILQMEPNLVKVSGRVAVIGDIHGQYYDLAWLLENRLERDKEHLVFLGDYVDRGCFSIEVLVLLLALKVNGPSKVTLLRGNHECEQMTSYFNFKHQCLKKYDQQLYALILDLFNALPLVAIVNNTYFCVHGGISAAITNTEKIRRLKRFEEIPNSGLFCDLMWADPLIQEGGLLGCNELASEFLAREGLQCVVRGHQAEEEGYRLFTWKGKAAFPQVMTVFSAPNYCDFYNNQGSFMRIQSSNIQICQYREVSHPYLLPDFMDAFQWSMPFVAERLSEMMFHLLDPDQRIEIDESNDYNLLMKQHIMRKIYEGHRALAQNSKTIANFQGRTLDNCLAHDAQAQKYFTNPQSESTSPATEHTDFLLKRSIDLKHEKRPLLDLVHTD